MHAPVNAGMNERNSDPRTEADCIAGINDVCDIASLRKGTPAHVKFCNHSNIMYRQAKRSGDSGRCLHVSLNKGAIAAFGTD